ncbi:hypothetical protein Poly51_37460 [Rubripirellula tenax]|uniref:COMM domain-containing protein n=1 Tax=Rubripirellula tenax TaxID=2528015 RepID=A0A5C6F3I7_9BACT|nr:hypothetical protein [Rubripirellula tenax]TWU54997.1 hypothetical protein Poly51_37460 [Rubripirellula tenax]
MSDSEQVKENDFPMSDQSPKFPEPSLNEVISGSAMPPEMLRDFFAISRLETAGLAQVVQSLGNLDGLGNQSALEHLILKALGADTNKDVAKSIRRTINSLRSSNLPKVLDSLDKWVDSDRKEREQFFSPENLTRLRENLNVLITENSYGKLIRKAERLLRDVGNEFRDVKFVCDLRPVFDDSKEHVDAFVILTHLRIHYVTQGGDNSAFELALTEDELTRLRDDIGTALEKVSVLKSIKKNLVVPNPNQEET